MEQTTTNYAEHQVNNTVYKVTSIYQQGEEKEDIAAKIQRLILNHREIEKTG